MLVAALCALASITACSHAPQQPQPPEHSKAALLLEQSAAQPGTETRIGIQFVMDKDWHIYWLNPGDSGEPPVVHWQLPPGVTAAALEWPSPTRLSTTAGTDYGYQGNVVLLSTFTVSAATQPGTSLPIAATVNWLVCHDICIPQRAQLDATLRVATPATQDGNAHSLLTAAAQQIPTPLPASFHLAASNSSANFRLSLIAPAAVASAIFFPANSGQIDNSAPQQLSVAGNTTRLELKKSDYLQHDPERLQGLLVLNGKDSYQVDVPLRTSHAAKEKHP
jgi:thiol:disulfide interchange protein DsbD